MVTLENDFLKVSVRTKGAEMTSFFNKISGIEHLWQADPSQWGWHAPNLFPVVGGCHNNLIRVDGQVFPMERHGFARNSEFSVVESNGTHAKFSLTHSKETREIYPFKFAFQVLYDLFDSELRISYKVINYDDQTIWFSVGGHPAFNIPFFKDESLEDYFLEFENDEVLKKHLLSANGFFTGQSEIVLESGRKLNLNKDLFRHDALVFKDLTSRKLWLKSRKHDYALSMNFQGFNYLGIWAKGDVPFICLEPWIGCADTEGQETEFKSKEGIHSLDQGHVFEVDYTIGISQGN